MLCAILTAIGGVFFFSLRSIENLNRAERSSALGEIAILHRVGKNLGLRQVEIFRHVAATNPEERQRHEHLITRLAETNTKSLIDYGKAANNEIEKRLYAEALQARKAYSDRTEQLLALSRAEQNAEATAFALTTQVPAYDQYQSALDALLRAEEAEGRGIAATTTGRIEQTRIAGDILIGLAIVIALGTGAAVLRMVRRLRQDKKSLQTEVDEHEQAEQALRESEARYRLLVDHSPDAILVVCDEKIVFVNPATLKLLGANSLKQLIGRSVSEILHPDERAEVARRSREVAAGKQPPTAERRLLRLDGSTVEVESRVISFLYEGKPAVQVIVRDNTERKAVQKQLHEADEKYRSIFDNASEGIFQSGLDGVFISANPALARMAGYASPEELIRERKGLQQQNYVDPAKRDELQRLLENGGANNFEYEAKLTDGSTIWVSENVRTVSDAAGNPLYYEGSVRDITEHKRSEEELLRSEARFRSFTKATWEIVWQTDPAGQVLEDLPSWRAYTGQTLEEIIGTGWIDCVHPEDRPRTLRHWDECRANKSVFEIEYRMLGADKTYRLFSVRGVPVLDANGAVREWIGANTDITERKLAEEVLSESERRFRFLNDLSDATHSLSQPNEIMAAVAQLLGKHLRVSRCAYAEVEKDGDHLTVPGDYTDGCASVIGEFRLSDFGEHTHSKMAAGRTLVLQDVDAELTPAEGAAAFNAIQIKAMISCPLIKNGSLVAMMAVHHLTPRHWTNAEIALVQEVVERSWSIIERARAEIVLRESAEHLRLVIAASNDGIWEHDFVTDVLTWSDRMYEMFGLERGSFVPSVGAFTALLHPDDRASFQKAVREQMANGGRYEAPTRILRGDGTFGNFLGRGRVVLDDAGKPIRIVGSLADLTSLLQAERKTVEQANLLNLAHDAIMVRDMDDRIEFWNHGAEVLYGWTAAEASGRLSGDFLYQEEPVNTISAQRTFCSRPGLVGRMPSPHQTRAAL